MTDPVHELAELLARVERLERAQAMPALPYSSLDDAYISEKAIDGTETSRWGRQFDGTHTLAPITSTKPQTPTDPHIDPRPGGLQVVWDGGFLDDDVVRMDFARVEVHASITPGFTPSRLTLAHVFDSPQGGEVFLPRNVLEHYIVLVTRTQAGVGSDPSGEVAVTPLPAADVDVEAIVDEVLARIPATDGTTITYATIAPNEDGTKVGDTWWQLEVGLLVGQWRWDGDEWEPMLLDGAMFANIDAGTITVGQLNAALIEAGTLTVDKLTFSVSGNLVPDATFANPDINAARAEHGNRLAFGTDPAIAMDGAAYAALDGDAEPLDESARFHLTAGYQFPQANFLPVDDHVWYRVVFWLRRSADASGRLTFTVNQWTPGESVSPSVHFLDFSVESELPADEWRRQEVYYRPPPGVTAIEPTIQMQDPFVSGQVYITRPLLERRAEPPAVTPGAIINLALSPSFEHAGSSTWGPSYNNVDAVTSIIDDPAHTLPGIDAGTHYRRIEFLTTQLPPVRGHYQWVNDLDPDRDYTVSVYVRTNKEQRVVLSLDWDDYRVPPARVAPVIPANTWTRLTATARTPYFDFQTPRLDVAIPTDAGEQHAPIEPGDWLDIDCAMVHEGAEALDYFDGDTPPAEWAGPPESSPSVRIENVWGAVPVYVTDRRYTSTDSLSTGEQAWQVDPDTMTRTGFYYGSLDAPGEPFHDSSGWLAVAAVPMEPSTVAVHQRFREGEWGGTPGRIFDRIGRPTSGAPTWEPWREIGGTPEDTDYVEYYVEGSHPTGARLMVWPTTPETLKGTNPVAVDGSGAMTVVADGLYTFSFSGVSRPRPNEERSFVDIRVGGEISRIAMWTEEATTVTVMREALAGQEVLAYIYRATTSGTYEGRMRVVRHA